MTVKRTATLGAGCGALAVWLAAAATSGTRAPAAPPISKATAVEERGAELAAEIAHLRERLRPTATPLQTRDLFRYGRGRAASRPAAVLPEPPPVREVIAPMPALPAFKLVGIAEDAGDNGPVRTAIISSSRDLFLVKEGEAVTLRYRVAKISPEAVELTDVGDGTVLHLILK